MSRWNTEGFEWHEETNARFEQEWAQKERFDPTNVPEDSEEPETLEDADLRPGASDY